MTEIQLVVFKVLYLVTRQIISGYTWNTSQNIGFILEALPNISEYQFGFFVLKVWFNDKKVIENDDSLLGHNSLTFSVL